MEDEDVPALARAAGKRLADGLLGIPAVRGVRGLGLLLAAELTEPRAKQAAVDALAAGLVINAVTDDALRLAPSLLVSDEEIDEAVTILTSVLA